VSGVVGDEIERVILEETQLLDRHAYKDWLSLYADSCTYWVPAGKPPFDPARNLSIIYDDRASMEQRVERLSGRFAYSQTPPWNTVRAVSNVLVDVDGDTATANCVYIVFGLRGHESRTYPGHCTYTFRNEGRWLISTKTLLLLHADEPLEEIGYIL
jgi:3-phenylpropionate/cinnamic acid dioxygenase small subunit